MNIIKQTLQRVEAKVIEDQVKGFGIGKKIFQKYKKEFLSVYPKVSDEACKSNIELMLKNKEIKAYPYFLKINEFSELEKITECFGGKRPLLYEAPAQLRLRQMQEDMIVPYCNFSTMQKAFKKITDDKFETPFKRN